MSQDPSHTTKINDTDVDMSTDASMKQCYKLSPMTKEEIKNNPVAFNPFIVCYLRIYCVVLHARLSV